MLDIWLMLRMIELLVEKNSYMHNHNEKMYSGVKKDIQLHQLSEIVTYQTSIYQVYLFYRLRQFNNHFTFAFESRAQVHHFHSASYR